MRVYLTAERHARARNVCNCVHARTLRGSAPNTKSRVASQRVVCPVLCCAHFCDATDNDDDDDNVGGKRLHTSSALRLYSAHAVHFVCLAEAYKHEDDEEEEEAKKNADARYDERKMPEGCPTRIVG